MFLKFVFLNDELLCLNNCSLIEHMKKDFFEFFVDGCKIITFLLSDLPLCMLSKIKTNRQTRFTLATRDQMEESSVYSTCLCCSRKTSRLGFSFGASLLRLEKIHLEVMYLQLEELLLQVQRQVFSSVGQFSLSLQVLQRYYIFLRTLQYTKRK